MYPEGQPINVTSTAQAVGGRHRIYCKKPAIPSLFFGQDLADNVAVTRLDTMAGRFKIIRIDRLTEHVQHWINRLSIRPPYPRMLIDQFSGGNQQKAVLAKWLA